MTTEEKLKHFMDTTTEKVNLQNAKTIEEYEKAMEHILETHKEDAGRKADLQLKLKKESLEKKKNSEIAKRQVKIREKIGRLQGELESRILTEVRGKLERFMGTGEYERYLITLIRQVIEFAGQDEVLIYIDPEDKSKLNSLAAMTNTAILVSEYSFGGGMRAVIRSRNILIDQSFETKLKEIEETFVFHT